MARKTNKRKAEPEPEVEKVNGESGVKRPRGARPKVEVKRPKLEDFVKVRESGVVLTLGQGDTGQLGLGEDIMERKKPALIKDLDDDVVQVCAGGMHSVCLTEKGEVYTFGCNDEGALGRETAEDEDCFTPGKVELPAKVQMISAGDSHSVALTEKGQCFYWGTFRDSSGSFGLTSKGQIEKKPLPLVHDLNVVKIASGSDHVLLLTDLGKLYSLGCAEQGQLGRVGERFVARGGRRGLELLLNPDVVRAKNRRIVFKDVWAGSYSTYALTNDDQMLVCGLNNYNQLGIEKGQLFHTLVKSQSFSENQWKSLAIGQHHALGLDTNGRVFAIGRREYGRLGLGSQVEGDALTPTEVKGVSGKGKTISCGTTVSFASTEDGQVFSWGMGDNLQLGQDDESDEWEPKQMQGKQLQERIVLGVSAGGQHTMILAKDK